MTNPKISIIIPAYNVEKYITKCINSILVQSWTNWEAIIINDGSKDSTLELIQAFSNIDKRIKVINKNNEGVVKARNIGLNEVTGEFLTFLDGDDFLPATALELMKNEMISANADICVGDYILLWEENGREVPITHKKTFNNAKDCFKYCMKHGEMFLPIKLYKTNLFKDNVNIPTDIILQEDVVGLTQYLECVKIATHVSFPVYYYLKHKDSVTCSFSHKHIESLIKVLNFLENNSFAKSTPNTIFQHKAKTTIECLKYNDLPSEYRIFFERIWKSMPLNIKCKALIINHQAMIKRSIKKVLTHSIKYGK